MSAVGPATPTGALMQARALDWDVSGPLQDFPLLLVYHPSVPSLGQPVAQLAWAGFIGALTGLNSAGLVFGVIGVTNPDDTFGPRQRNGVPFLFLFHDILLHSATLTDAVQRVQSAQRTCDLLVGLGDGATNTTVGIKYSSSAAVVYTPTTLQPDYAWHPRKAGIVWWAMDYMCPTFDVVMSAQLDKFAGSLVPSDIVHSVFPIVNTGESRCPVAHSVSHSLSIALAGNLHVMIVDDATDTILIANARGANQTGPLNAYQRQYVLLSRQQVFAGDEHRTSD